MADPVAGAIVRRPPLPTLPTAQALVVAILVAGLPAAPASANGFIPLEGCYLGAYIELDHDSGGEIARFEQLVGRPHASYFRYVGYGSPFPFRWVRELHAQGILPHIAWEPNAGLDPVSDNDYLRGWAEAAGRVQGPVFLRYASEMNGTWQAYSGDPEAFIRKWRIVTGIMRELAPNVIMVWCPFATPQRTITDYYPGDEWVDWVGVNIYSVHHYDGDPNRPAQDDPVELLRYVYERYADRKPIAICEYAATHYCAACGRDVTEFGLKQMTRLYEALPTQFPRVKMICWFSVDTVGRGLASNNYSLLSSPAVLERYRQLTASPYFLGRVPELSRMVAELPPLVPAPAAPLVSPPVMSGDTAGPVETLVGPIPPTAHPLALARLGPVAAGEIDVAISGAPPGAVRGMVEVLIEAAEDLEIDAAMCYLDGQFMALTNALPLRFPWNADHATPGVHELRVVALNRYGNPVAEKTVAVIVADRSSDAAM